MKKLNKVIVSAALVALLALPLAASAQRTGGGERGAGGMGMQRGGMQFGGVTKTMLLGRNDVQKDLKVTAEQKAAIDKIRADQQAKMQARMRELRESGGGGMDMDAIRAEMEKMNKETEESINKVLDKDQQKRLGEIEIQFAGMRVILREDIQKTLGMKADQKRQLDELQEKQAAANASLFQRVQSGEVSREELGKMMEENNKILDAEFEKVLTAEQKDKLKEMQGAKFARDPKEDEAMRTMGRGGRGGGGGN